ncbi:hypothetical protein Y032_0024g895 [Ancylostoma ceylanicum]|uniref:Uncharacterized protein n=1 Tax=Ancylostoma ceylanicum TaxID=53326 RepID=A0A016UXK9_9BILA|nr:hypothetical protein Y032_0024g895 [Ancylostoma ceylanicum]
MGACSNSVAADYDCGNPAVQDLVRRTFQTKYGGRITAWGKRVLAVEDCAHPFDPEGDCLLFTYPAPTGAVVRFLD